MMILDKYEPKVEGLEPIEQSRRVTAFDCILSKEPLDETDPGYQPPKEAEERTPNPKPRAKAPPATNTRARGRGRGRGDGPRPPRRYNDDSVAAIESHDRRERNQRFNDERREHDPAPRGRAREPQPMRGRGRAAPRGIRGGRGAHEEPREPVRPPRERSADRTTQPPRRGADRRDRR